MKLKNKFKFLIIIIFVTINTFSMSDSLKWSIGYGTLYGGGIGIKYEPFKWFHKKVKLHIGTSISLLPILAHDSIYNKSFINIYQNINKKIIFDEERIDKIFRERYIIPFSINISYSMSKNVDFMLGYGTLSRVYTFEKLPNGFLSNKHAIEIYKLSACHLSFLYRSKQFFSSLTYSMLFIPLRYFDSDYFTYFRDRYSYSTKSFTLTLSLGYYLR